MAVIGKIREKSALLLLIIGFAMVAFILGDLVKSGRNFFGGGNNLGEIGNVQITGVEFNNRLDEKIAQWEAQNNKVADGQVREGIRDQVWNELIREDLLVKQFDILGITVSPEELDDMITGKNPHPSVRQSFTNPQTGVFEAAKVIEYLKGLDRLPAAQKNQWLMFEDAIQKERRANKYNNMLTKGMYATTSMIKRAYKEQNEFRDIKYVAKRYTELADSSVTVSDAEIQAYYDKHKKEYKQEANRDIDFVKFDVTPSETDRADAQKWINEVYEEFKTAENDSAFVADNPDEASFAPTYYSQKDFPKDVDSSLFFAEIGTTTKPIEEAGAFVVTKLTAIKMVPDSVKARHILLKYTKTAKDTTLKGKLDSIKTVIENGGDFAAIAKDVSEDVGSAIKGGDLGWFKEGMMVKEFNDACFDGKVGDLTIVQTKYGFHLIEILDQAAKVKKVQLAKLIKQITPSSETYDAVFAKASAFYSANNTSENFIKATASGKFNKQTATGVRVADKNINGLQNARDIVRWAFKSEKGAVSEPKQFENTFVIAHLAEVKEEGIAPLSQVRLDVERGAKKDKKAAIFIEEMKGILDLDKLAEKIGGRVETATKFNFASYSVPGLGQEFSLFGAVSTIDAGLMTKEPIKGQTGVFVVMVTNKTEAPETKDYSATKEQLNRQFAGVSSKVLDALKDKYGVVDERYKFY